MGLRVVWVAAAIAGGCAAPGMPGAPPITPGGGDGLTLDGLRGFYLIGDGLTPEQGELAFRIAGLPAESALEVSIDGEPAGLVRFEGGGHLFSADVSELGPGEHELVVAGASGTEVARATFLRSFPLYVVVSTDWDTSDNPTDTYTFQEQLHAWHPELVLTHFAAPYTFTDPVLSPARVRFNVEWLTSMRDGHGDEIGVHIHPYCHFVSEAGVACRTQPSFRDAAGDPTGYTVVLASYTEEEMLAMLRHADDLFAAHDLGKPTSFRAGGWTAEAHTLRALARAGYVADTSAMTWRRLEEWENVPGSTLYGWVREHWADIDERSQPYWPAFEDAGHAGSPNVGLLEVPDNGVLVDYVSAAEMIDVFETVWDGGALGEPRTVSIGYHPPNFRASYRDRIDDALGHFDQFLASGGRGPVVYARLSDLVRVWPDPDAGGSRL
jgi:hypothetical protein